jgi:tRNA-2-methylthio-N6-dimethylallyladenosine synthase
MPQYYVWTIGCQMNKAESERIADYLHAVGYREASSFAEADVIVLNTCVVRQSAEDRVLGTLGLLKGLKRQHPHLSILVTGCFVDSNTEELRRAFPHVDLFFKPGAYSELAAWTEQQGVSTAEMGSTFFNPGPSYPAGVGTSTQHRWIRETSSPCALVPVIQGCDNFCSYCIVPYRRGREVSRPVEEVIREVEGLVGQGVKEVTLLGQKVNSYGHDLPGYPDLPDLLGEMNKIRGLARIRFLTNHPKDMTRKLINAMASLDRVCEHLDLAVQSGDNEVLTAMRRGYTVEQFRELLRAIRLGVPGIAVSTDIIVGFPGEGEEQFGHTFSLLEEARFDVVHVAAYSPRRSTIAWRKYEDDVPLEVKRERLHRIERLQARIAGESNSKLEGKSLEVLVEGKRKGKWYGRSRSDKLVFFEDRVDRTGQLVEVRIDRTSPWSLQGESSIIHGIR